jgi:hypothetical protein
MLTISSFYGILIRMYYDEYGPTHFHVAYQDYSAAIDINSLEVRAGYLLRRALNLVLDWTELHRDELRANWVRIEQGEQLSAIRPLE